MSADDLETRSLAAPVDAAFEAMTFPTYRRLLALEPTVRHPEQGDARLDPAARDRRLPRRPAGRPRAGGAPARRRRAGRAAPPVRRRERARAPASATRWWRPPSASWRRPANRRGAAPPGPPASPGIESGRTHPRPARLERAGDAHGLGPLPSGGDADAAAVLAAPPGGARSRLRDLPLVRPAGGRARPAARVQRGAALDQRGTRALELRRRPGLRPGDQRRRPLPRARSSAGCCSERIDGRLVRWTVSFLEKSLSRRGRIVPVYKASLERAVDGALRALPVRHAGALPDHGPVHPALDLAALRCSSARRAAPSSASPHLELDRRRCLGCAPDRQPSGCPRAVGEGAVANTDRSGNPSPELRRGR